MPQEQGKVLYIDTFPHREDRTWAGQTTARLWQNLATQQSLAETSTSLTFDPHTHPSPTLIFLFLLSKIPAVTGLLNKTVKLAKLLLVFFLFFVSLPQLPVMLVSMPQLPINTDYAIHQVSSNFTLYAFREDVNTEVIRTV